MAPAGSFQRGTTQHSSSCPPVRLHPEQLFISVSPSPQHTLTLTSRAREIQAQEGIPGLPLNPWGGPPTSGNSTPLRENIPESPTDGFPDFAQLPTPESLNPPRRARAGTVPSRFPPGIPTPASHLGAPGLGGPKLGRSSQSPFGGQSTSPGLDTAGEGSGSSASGSALLSRLRAGSLPQRSQYAPLGSASSASPFGPSIFSSWNPPNVGRERGSTLASIASVPSNDPSSPSQSHFSREGGDDVHMRTLDYLGLAETPQHHVATPYMPSYDPRQASRIRSYSVNNTDLHADEYPDDDYDTDGLHDSQYATLQDQLERTNAAIRSHNMAVQAFANHTTTTRRRAQTAGALDNPAARGLGPMPFGAAAGLVGGPANPSSMRPSLQDDHKYDDLPQAVADLSLGRSSSRNAGLLGVDDQGLEGPTSALWLGNIPTSTTTTTLEEMFKIHGKIISVRVLTHKNCGFVNFERVESAIAAKASMNGKELFPGATGIRINFAKPASPANTPGHDGAFPSPSPDPFGKGGQEGGSGGASSAGTPAADGTIGSAPGVTGAAAAAAAAAAKNVAPTAPELKDIVTDILAMVERFGATEDEVARIAQSLERATTYEGMVDEVPPIREPSHARVHDAPKLRELRKRIDNNALSLPEIEEAALAMLPEIAELSSDYLGNTVVQKLFDHCTNDVRDAMLANINPHLAEIGCHKNGTWAAQRIIDVCKTDGQMSSIADNVHPYTYALFLDQFGNYVVQCCLKFGLPYNQFIFETMMSHMARLSQARFGARAMRACLESHHTAPEQHRMLAAQIAAHSVNLATDQNGALLLTWYLDTCNLPQRRAVLAPRLIPYLVHLCTHKVAYLTVLKVINQKAEPDARDQVLSALFFTPNDEVLTAILSDSTYGATFIFKVLTTPFFDDKMRLQVVENVKNVLVKIKAQSGQGYKRLMDEVGLSRNGAGSSSSGRDSGPGAGGPSADHGPRQRPGSRHTGGIPTGPNGAGRPPQGQPQGQPPQPQAPFYPSNGYDVNPAAAANGVSAFPPFGQGPIPTAPAAAAAPGGPYGPPLTSDQLAYQERLAAMRAQQQQQQMYGGDMLGGYPDRGVRPGPGPGPAPGPSPYMFPPAPGPGMQYAGYGGPVGMGDYAGMQGQPPPPPGFAGPGYGYRRCKYTHSQSIHRCPNVQS